jgi:2-ketocyclohexanecarboxyl-CoA hydrolase
MADVEVERTDRVVRIVLNRPERRNAYDGAMAHAVADALDDASDVGVVVITGAGGSFCAGGYLGNLEAAGEHDMRALYRASLRMLDSVRACPRPVIAAVTGAAAGGGNELVIACDLAIAARSATFGQTGPKVGSAPVMGGTNALTTMIGEKRAKEMVMLCRRYTADEALAMGLINRVVEDQDLSAEVAIWCDELLERSARYLEISKISSNVWWNAARDSFATGLGMLVQAIDSPDMIEGARAFREKRRPDFPHPEPRPPATSS